MLLTWPSIQAGTSVRSDLFGSWVAADISLAAQIAATAQ
jgi:hypothetical protein